MNRAMKWGGLTAMLLFAAASAAAAQDKLDWKKDYKAALEQGKKEGKLVVVHFWGED